MNHKKTLDIAIWGLIALFVAGWIVLALQNLGFLSLWMDEGFHYLAAEGILKHGYPLFPSGHIYYKAILYTYILAFFSLVFGLKAATLRLISVLAIGVLIPSAYLVAKKFFSRTIGILAVGILTLSVWEAEYARLALYFAPLQLFYLLSLYFFYRGFVEDRKNFKILATIFFILIPLVHQLGMGVWFCFPALLFMKGLKRFFKKDVLASFSITTLFYVFLQLHEFFFWKVGYVYAKEDTSFRGMINYFVSGFSLDYFKEFFRSFPRMSLVVLAGLFLYLGSRFGKNGEPDAQTGTPDRTPWFYLNLCLFFPMLFFRVFPDARPAALPGPAVSGLCHPFSRRPLQVVGDPPQGICCASFSAGEEKDRFGRGSSTFPRPGRSFDGGRGAGAGPVDRQSALRRSDRGRYHHPFGTL